MENTGQLGPLPAPSPTTGISAAQRAVLEQVASAGAPVTLAALVRGTGLHENTLRGHLGALSRAGLVRPHRSTPRGRGRPALVWSPVPGGGTGAVEYAGLATALARTVQRTSRRPAQDAADAGRSWGRDLAGAAPEPDARRRLSDVLARLGFAPEERRREGRSEGRPTGGRGSVVRLTRCPLLDVARELPEVVCNVHRGLVEGVLDPDPDTNGERAGVRLLPFAEPGACLLMLDETGSDAERSAP